MEHPICMVCNEKLTEAVHHKKSPFEYGLSYAEKIMECGGIVDMSKAIKENDRVKIVSGPLKEMEARIIKMDPRNRNAKVSVDFLGRVTEVWLPFEYMDV